MIYIYSYFTIKYGLLDQVRVDGGQEFNLVCHIQEYLRDQRRNPATDAFKSIKSTDNNNIERIWVEVNSRVNYPIKNALGQFATDGLIDMTQDHVKFGVSPVSCRVAKVGLQLFAEICNHYSILLKGLPIDLMAQNNKAMPVDQLMSTDRAAEHYRRVTTRQLISMSIFGVDPLTNLLVY